MVQTKFVKYKTLKYFESITLILDIAKFRENYFLEIVNESKFVKYRASYMVFVTLPWKASAKGWGHCRPSHSIAPNLQLQSPRARARLPEVTLQL